MDLSSWVLEPLIELLVSDGPLTDDEVDLLAGIHENLRLALKIILLERRDMVSPEAHVHWIGD